MVDTLVGPQLPMVADPEDADVMAAWEDTTDPVGVVDRAAVGVTVEGLDVTELDGQGPTPTPIPSPQSTTVPTEARLSRAPRFCTTDAWTMEGMLRKSMLSIFIVSSGLGSVDYTGAQFSLSVKDLAALRTIRAGRPRLVSRLWSCCIRPPRVESFPLHNSS